MPRVTQKSVARHGVAFGGRVDREVYLALEAEAKRLRVSVTHVASIILRWWFEDDYLHETKTKKKPQGQ